MPNPSSVWPAPITAITLFVEDLGDSKQFYERVFDCSAIFEDDDSVVFRLHAVLLNLLRATAAPELIEPAQVAPSGAGARSVFTIEVEDVDARCAALLASGIALLNGPIDRPWGPRTASFRDPSGHIWEIAQS